MTSNIVSYKIYFCMFALHDYIIIHQIKLKVRTLLKHESYAFHPK